MEREDVRIFIMKSGIKIIGRPVMKEYQGLATVVQSIENPRIVISTERGGLRLVELIGQPDVLDIHDSPEASHLVQDKEMMAGYIKATSGLTIAS